MQEAEETLQGQLSASAVSPKFSIPPNQKGKFKFTSEMALYWKIDLTGLLIYWLLNYKRSQQILF